MNRNSFGCDKISGCKYKPGPSNSLAEYNKQVGDFAQRPISQPIDTVDCQGGFIPPWANWCFEMNPKDKTDFSCTGTPVQLSCDSYIDQDSCLVSGCEWKTNKEEETQGTATVESCKGTGSEEFDCSNFSINYCWINGCVATRPKANEDSISVCSNIPGFGGAKYTGTHCSDFKTAYECPQSLQCSWSEGKCKRIYASDDPVLFDCNKVSDFQSCNSGYGCKWFNQYGYTTLDDSFVCKNPNSGSRACSALTGPDDCNQRFGCFWGK